MNSKRFLKVFGIMIVVVFMLIGILNYFVSPFGLFGDKYMDWYSFDMTQNPRIAKVEYLKKSKSNFENFIVGASGASSFPTDSLKKYTREDYYNMFSYGADMLDSVNTVKWLVNHYPVKNIILPLSYTSAAFYDVGNDTFSNAMHEELDGTNKFKFYSKFLFANPRYSFDKIKYINAEKFLQESYNVFEVTDGSYDKRKRDIEPIASVEDYVSREAYAPFANFKGEHRNLVHMDEFINSVKKIKGICIKNEINLTVLVIPMYIENFEYFEASEIEDFYTKLAKVTDYYDFGKTSISYDPRYFYDTTHFRNDVGRMILSRIYNGEDMYIPEDFGIYVQNGDASEVIERLHEDRPDTNLETKLTVFMYHNFAEKGNGDMTIGYNSFKTQMQAIKDAGYTTVTPDEIYSYVNFGKELPKKAVMITMDDGYKSNLEEPYKILKEFGFKATAFVIGSSIGKDTYKDTEHKIFPHFSIEEAKNAMDTFSFGSHTFDMHQSTALETGDIVRNFAVPLAGEKDFSFVDAFKKDLIRQNEAIKDITNNFKTFAYPGGVYSEVTAVLLHDDDYRVTFLTEPHQNYLLKGLHQTAFGLGRFNMTDFIGYDETIKILEAD